MKLTNRYGGIIIIKVMPKIKKIGRDAITGRFIPINEAKKRPKSTVIEKIKVGRAKKGKCKK